MPPLTLGAAVRSSAALCVTVCVALYAQALAPALAEEAKDCAAVTDDARRLICYDAIFKIKQTSSLESKWRVTEEVSRMDDRKNVFVAVQSIDRLPGRFGPKDYARLMIACREGKTALYITFGGHFMSSLGSKGTVTYRIDKRPAAKRHLNASTDHEALGLWSVADAATFAREMFGAQSLYLQATPHSESPVSAEFPIANLEQAIKPLQEACKWRNEPVLTAKPNPSAKGPPN